MVAHRVTSLRNCDRIVELRSGKIFRSGSYEEIIEHKSERLLQPIVSDKMRLLHFGFLNLHRMHNKCTAHPVGMLRCERSGRASVLLRLPRPPSTSATSYPLRSRVRQFCPLHASRYYEMSRSYSPQKRRIILYLWRGPLEWRIQKDRLSLAFKRSRVSRSCSG